MTDYLCKVECIRIRRRTGPWLEPGQYEEVPGEVPGLEEPAQEEGEEGGREGEDGGGAGGEAGLVQHRHGQQQGAVGGQGQGHLQLVALQLLEPFLVVTWSSCVRSSTIQGRVRSSLPLEEASDRWHLRDSTGWVARVESRACEGIW